MSVWIVEFRANGSRAWRPTERVFRTYRDAMKSIKWAPRYFCDYRVRKYVPEVTK